MGACWGYYNLYREYRDASASSRWPRAQATILSSTIDEHRAHKGGRTWTNRIRYRYTVDGKAYESEVIRPGGFPSVDTEELAMKVWEKYQVDSIHQASYDPDSPSRAVLEPGVKGALSSLAFGATLATLFLLIPGVFFLWGATRS
ncbi:MAG TPA: DUF3592 domain-containing protein, partial [bacterium]|nr:DUF3592 domain-containing protein [bacterium]